MVGGGRSGKGCGVNAGGLPGQDAEGHPAAFRAAIVAMSPGNSGGAKGGREANASSEGQREATPPGVPATDKQGGEDPWQRHGAERGVWSEKMLAALEEGVRGNRWFSLIDKVYSERTLGLAWEKVRANAGACGVDGITVGRFAKDSQKRLLAVSEQIRRGTYQPRPVKRAWIPKPGSTERRPLGVPVVADRVVGTALGMVIGPIFERDFAPQSYGFRPGRGCRDALRRVEGLLRGGHTHVVDIDIRGYFDAIPHDRLMALVGQKIADGRVLGLIGAFLKAGVMGEDWARQVERGTPQGGVISPLLANIYLDPLDWQMAREGLEMVRYADDMVVLCREPETALGALETIRAWMREAGLELHEGKTRVVDMAQAGAHFDFLGYRFWRGRAGRLRRFIRPKSQRKLRERLAGLTRRCSGHCLSAIIAAVNPILRGWYGHFKHASGKSLGQVDGWVRARLRAILRKRQRRRGRSTATDHRRWGNRYFEERGLYCLLQARATELASLRSGVTR